MMHVNAAPPLMSVPVTAGVVPPSVPPSPPSVPPSPPDELLDELLPPDELLVLPPELLLELVLLSPLDELLLLSPLDEDELLSPPQLARNTTARDEPRTETSPSVRIGQA
jgi:hypothetical protein